jgi:hypothetical protein
MFLLMTACDNNYGFTVGSLLHGGYCSEAVNADKYETFRPPLFPFP